MANPQANFNDRIFNAAIRTDISRLHNLATNFSNTPPTRLVNELHDIINSMNNTMKSVEDHYHLKKVEFRNLYESNM
jgi:hypothetical protein